MLKQERRGIFFFREQPEEFKIITVYRFVSLISISVFFIAGDIRLPAYMKIFTIVCISLSSIILNYLYQRNQDSPGNIKLLMIIETIGNSLFLLPTGGLNSPFVWYSINTILIAAVILGGLYCWINLSVYLFISTYLVYLIFNNAEPSFIQLINSESNLILSLILITAIIRQLVMYIKRLRTESIKLAETNRQLNFANSKVKESMNHIIELYQIVYMFANLNDKEDMINTIIKYTVKITKADTVFFYNYNDIDKRMVIKSNSTEKSTESVLSSKMVELRDLIKNLSMPHKVDIDNKCYLIASVRTNCVVYGVLGIEVERDQLSEYYVDYIDQLKFMSGLGSIVFEKFEMEQINERLVITEEQNRIANEIHDSVMQRLFSTSFGIYGLMKKVNNMKNNELNEELNIIRNSIDNAMKELRTVIYGMSLNKSGTDNFVVDTMKFVEETRRLNDVEVNLKLMGSTEMLSLLQKKTLYRVICEGIGNAVRHGNAKHIEVVLNIQKNETVLKVIDDGIGFDLDQVRQSRQGGLGIKNIEALSQYLRGKAFINSSIGKGTKIKIAFPIYTHVLREEKIV